VEFLDVREGDLDGEHCLGLLLPLGGGRN
jgi:hypothetical protein